MESCACSAAHGEMTETIISPRPSIITDDVEGRRRGVTSTDLPWPPPALVDDMRARYDQTDTTSSRR